jgi:hypothetical protein
MAMPIMSHLWRDRRVMLAGQSLLYGVGDEKATRADAEAVWMPEDVVNDMISKVTHFDVQVASDLWGYTRGDRSKQNFPQDFGVMRLPFPEVWMEWTEQPEGDEAESFSTVQWAVYAREYTAAEVTSDPEWSGKAQLAPGTVTRVLFTAFNRFPDEPKMVIVNEVFGGVDLDADGHGLEAFLLDDGHYGASADPEVADLGEQATFATGIACQALGLINCRNVSTDDSHVINFKRTGTEKRRGIPQRKIRYHTIVLPGGGSTYDKATGRHRASALHKVRGHTKTFTAERPLMGKHVGTYWWGWQVRGDAENGMVVSDYAIGE